MYTIHNIHTIAFYDSTIFHYTICTYYIHVYVHLLMYMAFHILLLLDGATVFIFVGVFV